MADTAPRRRDWAVPGIALVHALWIVMISGVLIAYVFPENAISLWPWVGTFADGMARYVPAIDVVTSFSQFPQVTQAFVAIQWAIVVPICCLLFLFAKMNVKPVPLIPTPRPIIWLAPLMSILVCWILVILPEEHISALGSDRCDKILLGQVVCLMGSSRFWLGLLGGLHSYVFAFALVGGILRWPWWARRY